MAGQLSQAPGLPGPRPQESSSTAVDFAALQRWGAHREALWPGVTFLDATFVGVVFGGLGPTKNDCVLMVIFSGIGSIWIFWYMMCIPSGNQI